MLDWRGRHGTDRQLDHPAGAMILDGSGAGEIDARSTRAGVRARRGDHGGRSRDAERRQVMTGQRSSIEIELVQLRGVGRLLHDEEMAAAGLDGDWSETRPTGQGNAQLALGIEVERRRMLLAGGGERDPDDPRHDPVGDVEVAGVCVNRDVLDRTHREGT